MKRIMIFLEKSHLKSCLDLTGAAQIIAGESAEIYGIGINLEALTSIEGFDFLINVKTEIDSFDVMNTTKILNELYQVYKFDCILTSATTLGRMLAPRLAMKLSVGLVADVTELEVENNQLVMVRPAFTGKIMAGIISDTNPVMMSIRPGIFKKADVRHKESQLIEFVPSTKLKPSVKKISIDSKALSSDIRDSKLLVSCGGGMDNKLDQAEILAKKLGGKLAVSRRPVDAGAANRMIQVGQSGKIVSPKLYLALGISGAIQHLDGIKNVESIISVNTDRFAPLNFLADIVVQGDGHEFIDKLIERIERG